jgi:hypothetical protein
MEKEIRKFLTSISMLGLLASCTEPGTLEARNDNAGMAPKSIRNVVDHDELARRYENRARKLLEIAAEHEKRLQYYEDESDLYGGRHEQNSQSRATALVQKYKWAAEKATQAALHHKMASPLAKRDYIASKALH